MNDDDLERRLAARCTPPELPPALQACLAAPPVARGKIRWLWARPVPLAAAAAGAAHAGCRNVRFRCSSPPQACAASGGLPRVSPH